MHRRFRVLIIDDDANVLTMLRIILTGKGFDVVAEQDSGEFYAEDVCQMPGLTQ